MPAVTVAAWVKLTTKGSSMTLVSKGSYPDQSYKLGYDQAGDRFFFAVWESAGGAGQHSIAANSLGSPSTGTWYLVIGMLQADGSIQIQVNNGTVDDSGAGTVPTTFDEAGEFDLGFVDSLGTYLDGVLGSVMLWKPRALATQDRTDIWGGGAGLTYAGFTPGGATRPFISNIGALRVR